jgi:hypothetical protein
MRKHEHFATKGQLGMPAGHSGHEIPRTENRTEFTETEKFGSMFGTRFSRTEFTEVLSVLYLGKPKEPICTELEQ